MIERPVFHTGELEIQERVGVREKMQRFAPQVVRRFMPRQHQEFYQQLPMIFLGFEDESKNVWASVLAGKPGFIDTPDDTSMIISASALPGDPFESVASNDQASRFVGILGIDLTNRRRNRLSARISATTKHQVVLDIQQTFGNCPQYIQTRNFTEQTKSSVQPSYGKKVAGFNADAAAIIQKSDTFFVASSYTESDSDAEYNGADVSHRGGKKGFVLIEDDLHLLVPDFAGNNHYNTLGNIFVNPNVGMLFIDFISGDILTLTGTAKIIWDSPLVQQFTGAERAWRFRLKTGVLLPKVFPYRLSLDEVSVSSKNTGDWMSAEKKLSASNQRSEVEFHKHKLVKREAESATVTSFYFEPVNGPVFNWQAGQFITLRIVIDGATSLRNYTIADSPHSQKLRISVKHQRIYGKVKDGAVSHFLHRHLKVGDELELKAPAGNFTVDPKDPRPAVFLSAGIGITPMVAMAKHLMLESIRNRNKRPFIMVSSFKSLSDLVFVKELQDLAKQTTGSHQLYWLLTRPDKLLKSDIHVSGNGRMNAEFLRSILPLGRYQFFLCGPPAFMQSTYDILINLGVPDKDIEAESFGPASLRRSLSKLNNSNGISEQVAESAKVKFAQLENELHWQITDGSLLQLAESHGLALPFSCRNGQCGSCKVELSKGEVVHTTRPGVSLAQDEALLCCALPKQSKNHKRVAEVQIK
ncbi:MAG: pyridoxamine 5'-phosphate oxidase family protein [Aestuariibacter sp.]